MAQKRIRIKTLKLEEIREYENNPRRNDKAVGAVKESIGRFGYVSPIILDEDMVILAGHTRLAALKEAGESSVDCVVIAGMTEEQKKAFRIADNKVAEIASWDTELLIGEMKSSKIDWSQFGFTEKDLQMLEPPEACTCPRCGQKFFAE